MARVKVQLADNIKRVVKVNPAATEGAEVGTNLFLNGEVATRATLREWLGLGVGGAGAHQGLTGLRTGDDHPQYTMWSAPEKITGQWQWTRALWGPNGSAASPAFTFTSDPDTGWYRVGADNLGIATEGVLRWALSTDLLYQNVPLEFRESTSWDDILFTSASLPTGRIAYDGLGSMHITANSKWVGPGSSTWARDDTTKPSFAIELSLGENYLQFFAQAAGSGSFSWDSATAAMQIAPAGNVAIGIGALPEATTPLYVQMSSGTTDRCILIQNSDAAAVSGFVARDSGGTRFGTFGVNGTSMTLNANYGASGEVVLRASPSAVGIVLSSIPDLIRFIGTSSGTERARITSTGIKSALTGTAANPAFSLSTDTNTGFYFVGADNLGVTTGGTLRWDVSTTAITTTLPWLGQNGTAGAPAVSFSGDADTGLFRQAANALGLAAGGAEGARVDADTTAGNTRLLIYDVDNGTLERVTVGAADSGGTGYKVLRIPN